MRFGYFDDQQREYVITQPDTPTPWMNYLGCESFFGIISNTGGGYSFYKDARLRRLIRYRYNHVPFDVGGRFLYMRDRETGEYWSPNWKPVQKELDHYTCRQGQGYSIIASEYQGVRVETCYFVPMGENMEVWKMQVTNLRSTRAVLDLFAGVEFCLWDAWDDCTNFQRNFNTGEVEVEPGIIYHKTEYRERRNHFAYFACSEKTSGFDTQRDTFLGAYRGWDRPQAVETGQCKQSVAHGWAPVAFHQAPLELQPGETREIIFLLGYSENPQNEKFDPAGGQVINKKYVKPVIERYLKPETVAASFAALKEYWDGVLAVYQVETPDVHTNRMVNIWNAYQCMVTFNLSRSASGYESGIGRGLGFRDSNQDLLAFVQMTPERARERILDLAATQLPSGGAYHQYQPLTKRGNNDVGSNFNDDPLWLVLATAAYLKETGDTTILSAPVPYDNQPGSEEALYGHLQRSMQYTLDRLGPHGLPLIGRADWNDCLNLNCFSDTPGQSFQTTTNKDGKVAESVFIGGLFVHAGKEMAEIARLIARPEEAKRYETAVEKMTKVVETAGWDGEWFIRAYDDFGNKVGSYECEEGKIFIEPQGYCVLAGIGLENGMAKKALDSVEKMLSTPHGIVLQQPAYTRYYINLGEISTYPPGYKENAGIFCHNNPWVVIAETRCGNADRAFEDYLRITPSYREAISEIHRCEPYAYAQMIAGKDAPTHGEAKNSWLTGTASWNYVAITQWILGIRPGYAGFEIDPVIPSAWSHFKASRKFRGVQYEIQVERGEDAGIWVDGQKLDGRFVSYAPTGHAVIHIKAVIG